jgi:hypothetical protein
MFSNIHPVNDKVENIYNYLILAFLFAEYIYYHESYIRIMHFVIDLLFNGVISHPVQFQIGSMSESMGPSNKVFLLQRFLLFKRALY